MYIRRINRTAELEAKLNQAEADNRVLAARLAQAAVVNATHHEPEMPDPECDMCALETQHQDACAAVTELQHIIANVLGSNRICRKFSKTDELRQIFASLKCLAGHKIRLAEWDAAIAAVNMAECRGEAVADEADDIECALQEILCDPDLDPKCAKTIHQVLNAC